MSLAAWIAAWVSVVSIDTLAIAHLIRRGLGASEPRESRNWFDHQRFVQEEPKVSARTRVGVAERVHQSRGVVVHRCSYGDELIEYPISDQWPEDAICAVLSTVEVL